MVIYIYSMHKYTAKLSLLLLIILEASIYDEGVLSEGVLSGRSLCLDGVMYGGGFVRGGFVRRGFCPTFACHTPGFEMYQVQGGTIGSSKHMFNVNKLQFPVLSASYILTDSRLLL